MTKVVPIFVAAMILLIRILLIGTFSIAGDRLFTTGERRAYNNSPRPVQQSSYRPVQPQPAVRSASSLNRPMVPNTPNTFHPAPKPTSQQSSFVRPEPTYHNLSFNGPSNDRSGSDRSYDA
jgi:hypothetical protein